MCSADIITGSAVVFAPLGRNAFGKNREVVLFTPGPHARQHCQTYGLATAPIPLRLICVKLKNGEIEVLATSLLDEQTYPSTWFKHLYHLRWGLEEGCKREKFRLEIENFSALSAHAVKQDFYARLFVLNLTAPNTGYCSPEMLRASISREASMNDQTQTNIGETGLDEAECAGAFVGDTLSEQDAAASSEDLVDTPMPVFLEDVDPEQVDTPTFLTRTNARRLIGIQSGGVD